MYWWFENVAYEPLKYCDCIVFNLGHCKQHSQDMCGVMLAMPSLKRNYCYVFTIAMFLQITNVGLHVSRCL